MPVLIYSAMRSTAISLRKIYGALTQEDIWCESIVDIYEKGISVGSMSKVFSLAGLRMGWIATHDKDAIAAFISHRDYDLISCGSPHLSRIAIMIS